MFFGKYVVSLRTVSINVEMKKRLLSTLIVAFLGCSATVAQGVKPLPTLHTEGRWLVDKHGNHVVLHGVMDTPNVYFNGDRWQGTKEHVW